MMIIHKQTILREVKDYFIMTLGIILYACSWAFFLLPYQIASGGVTGISAIVFYSTGIPIEYTYFAINAILLVIALKVLGIKFLAKTIYSIFMLSFFLMIAQQIVTDDNGKFIQILGPGQEFMSVIIGCSLIGIALAIVFLVNGSTGGTDIIAACVNKYKQISLGRIMIGVDFCIISSCMFIPEFGDYVNRAHKLVFGLCTMVIIGFMLDYVMNARRESVQFLIFSKKYDEIANAIGTQTRHGVTLLDAHGWFSKQETKVLCILTKRRESIAVFRIIKSIDPDAFVSQSSVIGVYGEGFDKIKVKAAINKDVNLLQEEKK